MEIANSGANLVPDRKCILLSKSGMCLGGFLWPLLVAGPSGVVLPFSSQNARNLDNGAFKQIYVHVSLRDDRSRTLESPKVLLLMHSKRVTKPAAKPNY